MMMEMERQKDAFVIVIISPCPLAQLFLFFFIA